MNITMIDVVQQVIAVTLELLNGGVAQIAAFASLSVAGNISK